MHDGGKVMVNAAFLPYELVAFVVHDLDLADIRSLSYSCKRFRFLVEKSN
jgi:hypothetical protein